jgi:hypothetical protein
LETDSHAPLQPLSFHTDILKIWILYDDDDYDDEEKGERMRRRMIERRRKKGSIQKRRGQK